jgi:formylglycine-generating enzyme required for sulfatase activity
MIAAMKRHALFVGVDDYADPTIQNLRCAVNDATELAGLFLYKGGFDRAEALPNPKSREVVLNRVRDLTGDLGEGDVFLFFFAGHGFSVKDGHVLVCAEDSFKDVKEEWRGLSIDMLAERSAGPFDRVFLLDACRTDLLAGHRGASSKMTKRDRDLIFRPAEQSGVAGGRLSILCSCDEGQSAGELVERGHGLFSLAVMEELDQAFRLGSAVEVSDDFRDRVGGRMRRLAGRAGVFSRQHPRKMGPPIRLATGTASKKSETDGNHGGRFWRGPRRRGNAFGNAETVRERDERLRSEASRLAAGSAHEPGERLPFKIGKVPLVLRWCPPGTITVLDHIWADVEPGVREAVETQERQELVKGFWMGEVPVTQALWKEVMGGNPSRNKTLFGGMRPDCPVDGVSWNDCQSFIVALGHRGELAGSGLSFRLPSHLEWEHAARAGFSNWPDGPEINRMGWFDCGKRTRRVRRAKPNAWGLYDLFGNVSNWCRDGNADEGSFRPFLSTRWFDHINLFHNEFPAHTGWDRNLLAGSNPLEWQWWGLRLSAIDATENGGRQ